MRVSLSPSLVRTVSSSRVVITATKGAIIISNSPVDCVFCGAVAEHTLWGKGVCAACAKGAKRLL